MTLENSPISPLQAAMLRDTLACSGRNIEQVEIVFSAADPLDRVLPAWLETVRETTALRMMFLFLDGEPVECVKLPPHRKSGSWMCSHHRSTSGLPATAKKRWILKVDYHGG